MFACIASENLNIVRKWTAKGYKNLVIAPCLLGFCMAKASTLVHTIAVITSLLRFIMLYSSCTELPEGVARCSEWVLWLGLITAFYGTPLRIIDYSFFEIVLFFWFLDFNVIHIMVLFFLIVFLRTVGGSKMMCTGRSADIACWELLSF